MEAREEWSCPRCGRVEEGQARACPRCGVPLVSRMVQAQPIAPASAWVRDAPVGAPIQPAQPGFNDTMPVDMPWQTSPPDAAPPQTGPRTVPTAPDTSAWSRNTVVPGQQPDPRSYVAADASSWVKGGPVGPPASQSAQAAPSPSAQPGAGQATTTGRSGGRKILYSAGFGLLGSIIASIILGAINVRDTERDLTVLAMIIGVVAGVFVSAPLSAYPALLAGAPMRALRNGAFAAILGAVIMTLTALALRTFADRTDFLFEGTLFKGALIWAAFGLVLGMIDGIVARAPQRMLLSGLGGMVGGLIAFLLGYLVEKNVGTFSLGSLRMGSETTFVIVGLLIGLGSGLIQEVAKQAWITIVGGPNANTQAIVDKAVMRLGSSEDADIDLGLYRDGAVAPRHFEIRRQGAEYMLAVLPNAGPLTVNGETVQRERRLKGGDQIQIGSTILQFNTRVG